ncbi:MAG: GntR family transcriptional regulator, partial [Myxococcales bacterium]|nr:GntR family transcriptional regulator [Myxococcales bacterium]
MEPRSDDDPTPVFLRLARAIAADVRRGRLRPGDAVPGTRELARELGVHRNTVVAAYRELVAEGWLVTEAARGTFVSTELPERAPRRFSASEREVVPARCGFDVGPAPAAPEVV